MWIWVIYDASTKYYQQLELCFNYVLPRNNRTRSIYWLQAVAEKGQETHSTYEQFSINVNKEKAEWEHERSH